MAEVKLTVKTNFADAEKDLQRLGEAVKGTSKDMTEAQKSLSSKNVDTYLEKQKRLADAVAVTRGESATNVMMQRNLRNEYERLYKTGIDPTSAGMVKLKTELDTVNQSVERNTKSVQAQSAATQLAQKAALAYVAAIGTASVALVANTVDVARQVDMLTEQAATLGMTTQEYQALAFVAERTGASMEGMDKAIQKMNVGIGQARQGSGALYDALSVQNPALLDQVVNAESSADAFALMMDAIGKVQNPMDRAALASVAFGKGNREIINTALAGGESIKGLVDEAYKYGVVSEDLEKKSGAFDDAQKNLAASFMGVRFALAEKMMPALTNGMQAVANFISTGEKLRVVMNIMIPILAAVTAGIVGLLIATKAQVAINALAGALAALNAVMLANPAVLITAAIVGIVAAIVLVVQNWDWMVVQLTKGGNYLKGMFAELGLAIIKNITEPLATIADAGRDLPVVGKFFGEQADALSTVNEYLKENAQLMSANAASAIVAAENQEESALRIAQAEKMKNQILSGVSPVASVGGGKVASAVTASKTPVAEVSEIGTATELTALQDKLALFENTEAVAKQRMLDQYSSFYDARIEQDAIAAENQVAFVQSQSDLIMGMKILDAEQEVALKEATAEKIRSIEQANVDAQFNSMQVRLSNIGGFFGNLQTIAKAAGKESRALAVMLKGIAIAEATLLGVKSVMQAAGSAPFPYNIPAIVGATAFAGAQIATAAAVKIPSAETGTNFVVPDSTRTDGTMLRVNRGEEVNVTPRGEDTKRMQQTSVFLDGRVILQSIQEFVDSGELRISADNIVGAY